MILAQGDMENAFRLAYEKGHQKVWKLIAEYALENMDFEKAKKAFIGAKDYQGLEFVKRVMNLKEDAIRKAEIYAYFKQYEKSERAFILMDRKDLAVDLRLRMGDLFRVIKLVKAGAGDDIFLEKTWNQIGDHFMERKKWRQAVAYYTQGRNTEKLVQCYIALQDYESLERVVSQLSSNSPMLNVN